MSNVQDSRLGFGVRRNKGVTLSTALDHTYIVRLIGCLAWCAASLSMAQAMPGANAISGVHSKKTKGILTLPPQAETIDLLERRLTIQLPQGTHLAPIGPESFMAAKQSEREQSRAFLEVANEKFVVLAEELFALAGPDFERHLRQNILIEGRAARFDLEKLALGGGLRGFLLSPKTLDLSDEAVLTLSVFVVQADDSVQKVAFYVNPALAKAEGAVRKLSKGCAMTLAPGTRGLGSQAGPRALSIAEVTKSNQAQLTVELPAGFIHSQRMSSDFIVHSLRRMTRIGEPPSKIGIYVGRFPQFQYQGMGFPRSLIRKVPGRLLGKEMTWSTWSARDIRPDLTDGMMEAIVQLSISDLMLHVFLRAENDQDFPVLKKIVETLKLESTSF